MRTLIALVAALLLLTGVFAQTKTSKTKRKGAAAAKKSTAKKSAAKKSASSKKGRSTKKKAAAGQTWRSRQLAPTPDRYREIQRALADRGYLKSEPDGKWDQGSVDALRRFQQEQNLEPTGKINSLSLIALGLGPKYDTTAKAVPPAAPRPTP